MTRLRELDASFRRITEIDEGGELVSHKPVVSMADAQGIMFLCPLCWRTNGGPVGTHAVICWSRSRGVPDGVRPRPGRWLMRGTGLDDLTLDADPPGTARSVLLLGGCAWHGFVNDGDAA